MRVTVTALFVVGVGAVAPVPMSFRDSLSTTSPISLNTVGHGVLSEHGAGDVTLVMTSDVRLPPKPCGLLPCAASSCVLTRITGDLPVRTTLPHDAPEATSAARVRTRMLVPMPLI